MIVLEYKQDTPEAGKQPSREHVVRVSSDQANRTNHQYQNNGQHNRILGDVLALSHCLTQARSLPYFCTKNSDIEGALAAAPGGSGNRRVSITVRSML
jgi:hypothetical protein